ncbi:MAG: endolytic transglycosylase MltG [Chloroflexi bacterium]|nr:endolytic transglycosylase MltG [Chloroflexota bacterium]
MTAQQRMLIAVAAGLAVMLAIGVWLLSATPGALVNDGPLRLGPTVQPDAEAIFVNIEEGEGAGQIAEKLEDAGVIESARVFRMLTAFMGVGDELAAGRYEFRPSITAVVAVQRISQGITTSGSVTIREGLRSEEIGELLEREGIVSAAAFREALTETYAASFLAELPAGASLEGFLFPATYRFPSEITAHEVVQRLLTAFDARYQESIVPLLAGSGQSLSDAVNLAAIVEREAQVPGERPAIASVFANRLSIGMGLQADPTVQYAVAEDPASVEQYGYWKLELTVADLAIDSPYNTYQHAGLPPAAIANPGLDSLLAATTPADTGYFYFVACDDGSGSHVFAETLDEHNQNVDAANRGECES